MIALGTMLEQVRGVDPDTLLVWITQDWVRPLRREGHRDEPALTHVRAGYYRPFMGNPPSCIANRRRRCLSAAASMAASRHALPTVKPAS